MVSKVEKRNGEKADFDNSKIEKALYKALTFTGEGDMEKAREISDKVFDLLLRRFSADETPHVEQIQDIVEETLVMEDLPETAKAYIIYREKRRAIRETVVELDDSSELVEKYIEEMDWQVKENANMTYSLQGLNQYATSHISKKYWLNKIYPEKIREAAKNQDFHIHDLNLLAVYCAGWDLHDLLMRGFGGVPSKIESKPPKHLRPALGQLVNFFFTLQGESAGAIAVSNFDTLLAPFIRKDNLDYKQVKQALQEFFFNCMVPTRVGFQCLSEDTEILTKNGWKKYNEVNEGDIIKTFNTEKAVVEEKKAKKVFRREYEGKMYNLSNRIQDQLVSPEHRIVRKKFNSDNYCLERVEDFIKLKSPQIVPISADNKIQEIGLKDEEIKLIARIISEGSNDSVKIIPEKLLEMSQRQSRLFLETYIKGDGHENCKITASNEKTLSDLQRIIFNSGYGFTTAKRMSSGVGNKMLYIIRVIRHQETGISKVKEVDYKGVIWSVNTDNETVIAKRRGKVFITGNTPFLNTSLDIKVPHHMKDQPVVIGGELQKETYGEFQEEMDVLNKAFYEVLTEGDAKGRVHTFPIPTISITKDFDWDNKALDNMWEATAKYGVNYFSNFVQSDMNPEDFRSMCLHAEEDIFVRKEGEVKKTTIGELFESYKGKELDNEWFKTKELIETISLNPDTGKLEWVEIDKFLQVAEDEMVSIETMDGKTMNISKDHLIAIFTKEGIKTKKAKEINKDDFLLTAKKDMNVLYSEGIESNEDSDFAVVGIRSIKKETLESKLFFYDIELKKNHYFVHSDGNITHNCCRLRLSNKELIKRGGGLFGSQPLTGCYDEKTEVLTENGWKAFKEVEKNERVYTLSENNEIELHKPIKYFEYDYNGEMHRFKAKSFDLLVTPNHRMVVDKRTKNKERTFVEAQDFVSSSYLIPKGGKWKGEEKKFFALPPVKILKGIGPKTALLSEQLALVREMRKGGSTFEEISEEVGCDKVTAFHVCKKEEYGRGGVVVKEITPEMKIEMDGWLKFFGIWLAEGCVDNEKIALRHGYRVIISQTDKEKKKEIENLLKELPFNYHIEKGRGKCVNFVICNKQLWTHLRQIGNKYDKFIPAEMKNLSKRQLKILFDWMVKGDGHVRKTNGQINYWTASKKLTDDLQEIVLKLGWMATAVKRKRENMEIRGRKIKSKGVYEIGVQQSNYYRLRKRNISREQYTGKVYCLEVPNNTLFVRRNGKVAWCGNSLGVVTINLPRIGYLSKTRRDFFDRLAGLMDLAKDSLEIKRKVLNDFAEKGLYPYSVHYLASVKKMRGSYFGNHFSTIGLLGMNESLLNFLGENIASKKGRKLALEVLDFMRERLIKYQEETGNLYNLEATPAEGASIRQAKMDKQKYPDIITAGTKENPYYTNSVHLPVNYSNDPFEILDLQDELQTKFTGGVVLHLFLGEKVSSPDAAKNLVKKVFDNYHLPYITLTPTFSICSNCGYLKGEQYYCPRCKIKGPKKSSKNIKGI